MIHFLEDINIRLVKSVEINAAYHCLLPVGWRALCPPYICYIYYTLWFCIACLCKGDFVFLGKYQFVTLGWWFIFYYFLVCQRPNIRKLFRIKCFYFENIFTGNCDSWAVVISTKLQNKFVCCINLENTHIFEADISLRELREMLSQ